MDEGARDMQCCACNLKTASGFPPRSGRRVRIATKGGEDGRMRKKTKWTGEDA